MADDKTKKPKIDLKARLNKTAAPSGPNAIPLPVPGPQSQPGSAPPPPGSAPSSPSGAMPRATPVPPPMATPRGIAPPSGMGLSQGIPLPIFGTQPRPQPAAPVKQQAQTIKVEVGEEIHEERKKATRKMILFAAIGAIIGGVLGFVWGGAKTKGDSAQATVRGSGEMFDEVKVANDKMKELSEKLIAADKKLQGKEFPDDLDLNTIIVDFDGQKLEGRGVGGLPRNVLRMLFSFTANVSDLNKTKDSLRNLLVYAKPAVIKGWAEEKEPVSSFSVIFSGRGEGKMMADLVPNKEPFALSSKEWPASYTITKPEKTAQGIKGVEKKATRWTKGDLTGNEPVAIPVDPLTTSALSGTETANRLARGMRDIREVLEGGGDPNNPDAKPGLLKEGEELANELKKIGGKQK
jgi:hypothetical protein